MKIAPFALLLSLSLVTNEAKTTLWPSQLGRLRGELQAPQLDRRYRAVRELGRISSSNVEPLLRLALDDPEPLVKCAAAEVVALRSYALSEKVIPWLSSDVKELRLAAVRVLASIPLDSAVEALTLLLFDKDVELRRLVVTALTELTAPRATEALRVALDDANDSVRRIAVRSLATRDDPRIDSSLSSKLSDIEPLVRADVVTALMARGVLVDDTLLRQSLTDPHVTVRVAAIRSLGGRHDEHSERLLLSVVQNDKSSLVVREAIGMLARRDARGIALELLRVWEDRLSESTRGAVQEAIGEHAPLAREVSRVCASLPAHANSADCLAFCLRGNCDVSLVTRWASERRIPMDVALDVVGLSASSDGLDFAIGQLDFESKRRLTEVLVALERILVHQSSHWLFDPLARGLFALRADEPDFRRVVRLLGMCGSMRAKAILLRLALDSSIPPAVVEEAIVALGRLGPGGLEPTLLTLLNHRDERIALAVTTAFYSTKTTLNPLALFEQSDRGPTRRALRFIVLSSMLASSTDVHIWPEVARWLPMVTGEERDALLEGIARNTTPGAKALLARLRGQLTTSDRCKIAEAWSGDDRTLDDLLQFVRDPMASVRAQAITTLGREGNERHRETLVGALSEPFVGIRVNALVSLGWLARRRAIRIDTEVCPFVSTRSPLIQEAALTALYLARTRCRTGLLERKLLWSKTESVRFAAARLVSLAPLPEDERDLALCAGFDVSSRVRRMCLGMSSPSEDGLGTAPRLLYVVREGQSTASAGTPFLVSDEMGLFRVGISDRRGASVVVGAARRASTLRVLSSGLVLLDEREGLK